MSKIIIIGAGAMGSAFALPCLDNNHDINIVGTHLENDFIDNLKKNDNLHPGLRTKIPKEINIFKFELSSTFSSERLSIRSASSTGRTSILTKESPDRKFIDRTPLAVLPNGLNSLSFKRK